MPFSNHRKQMGAWGRRRSKSRNLQRSAFFGFCFYNAFFGISQWKYPPKQYRRPQAVRKWVCLLRTRGVF